MQNRHSSFSKGFTLVELAVVLTIVALLIGGVLKGQEMIEDARVVATVAQVHSFEGAVTTFRKVYGELPGDLPLASTRIEGCSDCNPPDAFAGDGWVGDPDPSFTAGNSSLAIIWQNYSDSTSGANKETRLFWTHLFAGGFINDIVSTDADGNPEFGVNVPAAKIGGGFLVGSVPNRMESTARMEGVLLALVPTPELDNNNEFLLTPLRAAQIDRKMDDGFPTSGTVQDADGFRRIGNSVGLLDGDISMARNAGGGSTSSCRDLTAAMSSAGIRNPSYLEGEESERMCNLVFKIRN